MRPFDRIMQKDRIIILYRMHAPERIIDTGKDSDVMVPSFPDMQLSRQISGNDVLAV